MNVELVYVFPGVGKPAREHEGQTWGQYATRFASSYVENPPGQSHSTTIVCNGFKPEAPEAGLFFAFPVMQLLHGDNVGQDIGAFIRVAQDSVADLMICCGAYAHFPKPGWLTKILEYWQTFGPGLYGTAVVPESKIPAFVRTAGFICPPQLLREYPHPVVTAADRYAFEFGPDCLTQQALRRKMPVLFVNHDGAYCSAAWAEKNNRNQLIV